MLTCEACRADCHVAKLEFNVYHCAEDRDLACPTGVNTNEPDVTTTCQPEYRRSTITACRPIRCGVKTNQNVIDRVELYLKVPAKVEDLAKTLSGRPSNLPDFTGLGIAWFDASDAIPAGTVPEVDVAIHRAAYTFVQLKKTQDSGI